MDEHDIIVAMGMRLKNVLGRDAVCFCKCIGRSSQENAEGIQVEISHIGCLLPSLF
jgi:hypothetical protein